MPAENNFISMILETDKVISNFAKCPASMNLERRPEGSNASIFANYLYSPDDDTMPKTFESFF